MDSVSQTKLEQLLEINGLSPEEVLSQVGSLMRAGETEVTRFQATKLALELNKLIGGKQQEGLQAPVVNIVIQGYGSNEGIVEINPILVPRNLL